MIRTFVRGAVATAALAGAALVSVPGTALADTVVGPTFVIGNVVGNTVGGSDDGLGGELPGGVLPPAATEPVRIVVGGSLRTPLQLVSSEGAEFPRALLPNYLAIIMPFAAHAEGRYQLPGDAGGVRFVVDAGERPKCTAYGAVSCRFDFDRFTQMEVFIVDGLG